MAKCDAAYWRDLLDSLSGYLIGGRCYRMVENQAQVATRNLVGGDLAKQAVLEDMLESSKPPRVPGTDRLDYLLATPWRYPPLTYGSRFGSRTSASLFYAGLGVQATLAEVAFYRWQFYFAMSEPLPVLNSRHTLYQARYRTERGLRLQQAPFEQFAEQLTHKADYAATQALGDAMRDSAIEAFEYQSARDIHGGLNVAMLHPNALLSDRVEHPQPWFCATSAKEVVFSYRGRPNRLLGFSIDDFLYCGELPQPA